MGSLSLGESRKFSIILGPDLKSVTADMVLGFDMLIVSGKTSECHVTRSVTRKTPGEIQFLGDICVGTVRILVLALKRSEERRVGKECSS